MERREKQDYYILEEMGNTGIFREIAGRAYRFGKRRGQPRFRTVNKERIFCNTHDLYRRYNPQRDYWADGEQPKESYPYILPQELISWCYQKTIFHYEGILYN